MALKTTISVIVHHACRTRVHCPIMVSSFKLSTGPVCLPRFCHFWSSNASGKNPLILDFSLYGIYDRLCDKPV